MVNPDNFTKLHTLFKVGQLSLFNAGVHGLKMLPAISLGLSAAEIELSMGSSNNYRNKELLNDWGNWGD